MPSPFALLLRVLLSLSLILNGSGYAWAATQMQLAHGDVAHDTAPATRGCHEHGMAATKSNVPAAADVHTSKPGYPAPDCCRSGKCVCASMQPTSLTLASLSLRQPEIYRIIGAPAIRVGHASPLLAHPIRPPIG
jgi:hypothetical protein